MEHFSYPCVPLLANEIRYFTLLPNSIPGSPEPVRIKLTKATIDNLPEFHALSYHWGHPESEFQCRRDIFVDNKCLKITRSLETALRALRTTHGELSFWADQICINQNDSHEKGMQLPHMATIFGKSTRTIAWLGEQNSFSTTAMRYLGELGFEASQLGITHLNPEQYRQMYTDEDDDQSRPNHIDVESATCRTKLRDWITRKGNILDLPYLDAILELCRLQYFVRGWIREEIALPKTLLLKWGNAHIDADTFCDAINLLKLYVYHFVGTLRRTSRSKETKDIINKILEKTEPIDGPIHPSISMRRQYQFDPNVRFFSMAHILRRFRHLEFTNPRDRVYGVLGLANDWENLGIPIRYSKYVTDETVFTETTKKIIQKDVEDDDPWGGINFMSLCGENPPKIAQSPSTGNRLPSWVPNLNQQNPFTLADETRFFSSHPFNASRGFRHPITREEQDGVDQNIFLCSVVVIDRIKRTGVQEAGLQKAVISIARFALDSREIVTSDTSSVHPYCSEPQKLVDARWRVPVLDHEFLSNPTALRRATGLSREGYIALLGMNGADSIQNSDTKRNNYLESLNALKSRMPFLGEKGFLGIGPSNTQKGDLVCVIRGGAFPFILRESRSAAESAYHELVGEAFCDGIMDGEAFHMGIPSQKFRLI